MKIVTIERKSLISSMHVWKRIFDKIISGRECLNKSCAIDQAENIFTKITDTPEIINDRQKNNRDALNCQIK